MDNKIIVFSKSGCPYCEKTKSFLQKLQLPYTDITLNPNDINYDYKKNKLFNHYNHQTFPIILINNKLIGGYTELINAYNSLKLHKMCHEIGLYLSYDF